MIGAIVGDIVGSVYEWRRIKTKSFEFFVDQCDCTDDSICTAAVADILMHDLPAGPDAPAVVPGTPARRLRGQVCGLDP